MQKIAVGPSALVLDSRKRNCAPPMSFATGGSTNPRRSLTWPSRIEHNEASPVPAAHLAGDPVTHGGIPAAMAFPHRFLIEAADHHDRANKGFSGPTANHRAHWGRLWNRFSVLRTHLAACVESCEYYQATALYNEVSGISDAELHRRGLSLPRSASVRPNQPQKLRLPTSAQFAREATPVLTPLS